jgi:hypothetical protein
MGTLSDIHALIDELADEELDVARACLNTVRARDGFESLSEDDFARLRSSVRRGLPNVRQPRAARSKIS